MKSRMLQVIFNVWKSLIGVPIFGYVLVLTYDEDTKVNIKLHFQKQNTIKFVQE